MKTPKQYHPGLCILARFCDGFAETSLILQPTQVVINHCWDHAIEKTLWPPRSEFSEKAMDVKCPNIHPEPHLLGEFPMSCYECHIFADS